MQENEFEKQVRDKMEVFQLPPLDAAWEKVSRRITEDKRKKRYFIFLLFFGLIAAGVSAYFIAEKNTKKLNAVAEVKHDITHKNDNSITKDSSNNSVEKTLPATTEATATVVTIDTSNNINKRVEKQPVIVALNNSKNSKEIFKEENKSNKNVTANTSDNKNLARNKSEVVLPENESKDLQVKPQAQVFSNSNIAENKNAVDKDSTLSTTTIAINNVLPQVVKSDSINNILAQQDSIINTKPATVVTAKKAVKKSSLNNYKIPNWQWGFNAFYGRSNLAENIVDFNKSAPSALNSVGGVTGNGRIDSFSSSKLYSSSSAYSFGAVVQKKILRNAVIGAGINYEHLSVKSHISSQVNSGFFLQYDNNSTAYIISNFYRPGNTSVYTNNFNFIELPFYFQQDIFHSKKVFFAYNAGFSVRQLLSSKALIYNEANGIYYFKNGLINKTQFQLQGGLNIKFNTGKSTSMYVGPQFSYSLSNGFKNANDGTFHFINYGLQAGLLLHKK